ncbi:mitochondrial inner membrane protein Mitofilin [Cunninghamella echinulata]|nr:mitochondrial inner membrane protein Mitofilin [Cunninghamella echinulata]
MLRASALCKTTVRTVNQQRIGSLMAKRLETTTSTTATTKKSGSLFKKIAGLTIVGGAAYGGAVYYALNDDDFHDLFTTYVPGGSETMKYVELIKKEHDIEEYKNQAEQYKKQADSYLNLAKEYGSKAKLAANDAYDYASSTYNKLTNNESATVTATINNNLDSSQKSVISTTLPNQHPSTTNASAAVVTSKEDKSAPVITAVIETPPPIVVQRVITKHATVRELSRVVTELAAILNENGLANAGRDLLIQSEQHIKALDERFKSIEKEHDQVLQQLNKLKERGELIDQECRNLQVNAKQSIQSVQASTFDKVQAKEKQIIEEFDDAREKMKQSFKEIMAAELNAQKQELEHERTQALYNQAESLKAMFIRDAKFLIEQERSKRISTLTTIHQRFQAIEQSSLENAVALDRSRQIHQLYVALSTIQDVLASHQHEKFPFKEEWQALQHGVQKNEHLQKVLSSVSPTTTEEGIFSMGDLTNRFDVVANEVRRVALVPEEGGFGAHILSFIMSHLLFKKYGLVEGNDVEAILARSQYYLQKKDLESAARELNQLSGWPKRLAVDWIQAAREHLEVKQALEIVETHVILSNLIDA